MRWLGRRDYSCEELARRLSRRYRPDVVERVVAALQERGYLDDTRFVENYITARRAKGFGPLRIQSELLRRGIGRRLAAESLRLHDEAWVAEARRAKNKKFGDGLPQAPQERLKVQRFLANRGFTDEQIHHCLR